MEVRCEKCKALETCINHDWEISCAESMRLTKEFGYDIMIRGFEFNKEREERDYNGKGKVLYNG